MIGAVASLASQGQQCPHTLLEESSHIANPKSLSKAKALSFAFAQLSRLLLRQSVSRMSIADDHIGGESTRNDAEDQHRSESHISLGRVELFLFDQFAGEFKAARTSSMVTAYSS